MLVFFLNMFVSVAQGIQLLQMGWVFDMVLESTPATLSDYNVKGLQLTEVWIVSPRG